MNCRLVRRHLGAYADGELDAATVVEFERHLEVCDACREHLGFETAFRDLLSDTLRGVEAPPSLKAKISDDLRREAAGPLLYVPWDRRLALPAVAAVAVLAIAATGLGPLGDAAQVQRASSAALLEDVVRVHSSGVPADVEAEHGEEVARYFAGKVRFPVHPARFSRPDARLLGARLSHVRERQAAALFYDVGGRRLTVVVFDGRDAGLDPGLDVAGQPISYRQVGGRTVPVRHHGGLSYAFAGDFDRDALLRLAASADVRQ